MEEEKDALGNPVMDENGKPRLVPKEPKIIKAGTPDRYIDTDRDLAKIFNAGPGHEKFRRIYGDEPRTVPNASEVEQEEDDGQPNDLGQDTLDGMNLAELKAFAHGEDIPLNGATTKADIKAAIRAWQQAH